MILSGRDAIEVFAPVISLAWGRLPVIPEHRRYRHENRGLKASLGYTAAVRLLDYREPDSERGDGEKEEEEGREREAGMKEGRRIKS